MTRLHKNKQYKQALIITGDGDFYCLVKYLDSVNKLLKVLSPSPKNCSLLLSKIAGKKMSFVSDLRNKIAYKARNKEKNPVRTKP